MAELFAPPLTVAGYWAASFPFFELGGLIPIAGLSGGKRPELHVLDHGIKGKQDVLVLLVLEGEDVPEAVDHIGVLEQVGSVVLAERVADGGSQPASQGRL